MLTRSISERPSRSTDHDATTSKSFRATPLSIESSCGRSLRPLAPEMPRSTNSPATSQPRRCAAWRSSRNWFSVDLLPKEQSLVPTLTYRGRPLERPQMFLNEARLSGLGLALYLGGRLAC